MEKRKNETNLKYFKITGLFNKKDFFIEFDYIAKILISENGAGKTTILNIIVNFLKGNLRSLKNLPFKEIKVVLENEEYYVMIKENFFKNVFFDAEIIRIIKSTCFDYDLENELLKRIIDLYQSTFNIELVLIELRKIGMPRVMISRIRRAYEEYSGEDYIIKEEAKEEIENYRRFLSKINFNLEYFPTYRRIEKNFEIIEKNNYDLEINFGMSDVEKLINNLTEKIKSDTAILFSKMNKEIIYELIDDDKKISSSDAKKLIGNSNIQVVLNRIQDLNDTRDLKKLLDKKLNIKDLEGKFLGYYF